MKAIELFNAFLDYCDDYEIVSDNIVLKNDKNELIIFKPSLNKKEIVYQVLYEFGQESGVISNMEDLIDLVVEVIGEDKVVWDKEDIYNKKMFKF